MTEKHVTFTGNWRMICENCGHVPQSSSVEEVFTCLGMEFDMLIASYFVGRDDAGSAVCIVVKGIFLEGYSVKEGELEFRTGRTDLVQIFEQDGHMDGFILPDLPSDVVNLLDRGESISIVDIEAEQAFFCAIGHKDNKEFAVFG